MIITKTNSIQAGGYDDENIRQCVRCHGDGVYMGNPSGGTAESQVCDLCSGTGLLTLTHDPMKEYASEFARKGGKSKSPAKAVASKENGKKGGRPRKIKP